MPPDIADLLTGMDALRPAMRARAPALDEAGRFPEADMADLDALALLPAALPRALGGHGLGTEPCGALGLLAVLRLLGSGNLALGRLYEAHVNAVRLVARYAGEDLWQELAADGRAGRMLGLWVTDPPGRSLQVDRGRLHGEKQFCSGAGHITRAVVTAADAAGTVRLAYARLDEGATARPLPGSLSGMRAAATGQVSFDGVAATVFGAPGDYLREPDFSCGAWRTSAATLGGLDALVAQFGEQLAARGRGGDPHQQARFGQALLAAETARLWMAEAAQRAEADDAGAAAVAYVGLARLAVERACLDVIALAQRSLGVAALQLSNPVERICRDLATYLRQPAADMVLADAAAFHLGAPA